VRGSLTAREKTATIAKGSGGRNEAKEEEKRRLFLAFIILSDSNAILAAKTAAKPQQALGDGKTRAGGRGECYYQRP
jgi:hypothetical protein